MNMMSGKFLLRLLCLIIATGIILWSNGPFDIDDAPITYRYAENLAAGQGFVYNSGEYVLGTSTPLYTLILAGARQLGMPIPLAGALLNLSSSLAVVLLTMLLTERLSGSTVAAALAVLYLLLQPSFIRYTMAGMETPLYTTLILLTIWLAQSDRFLLAALIAGLAAIMRLDGLAIGGALFGGYVLYRKHLPWRAVGVYGLTLLPWILFAFYTFGSPIPLSMLAKQEHLQALGHSRYWIWQYLFTAHSGTPLYLLPIALIGLAKVWQHWGWSDHWLILLLWLVAYLSAYTVVGIDFYEWYLTPVYPILAAAVGIGLQAILLTVQGSGTRWRQKVIPTFVVLAILASWVTPYIDYLYLAVTGFQGYLASVEQQRVLAGKWLQKNTPPDATIYAGAIGHLGYESNRYIIDGAGLVTPAAMRQTTDADYYAMDGLVPPTADCGVIQEFKVATVDDTPPMIISGCNLPPLAQIGELTLANVRVAQWIQQPDHQWTVATSPYIEMQWRIAIPQPAGEWAVYVHFLDDEGKLLFQLDHYLGLQSDNTERPVQEWLPNERIYTYVGLPDDWITHKASIAHIRIGVWQPTTAEYLPITTVRPGLTLEDGLLLPIVDGEIMP